MAAVIALRAGMLGVLAPVSASASCAGPFMSVGTPADLARATAALTDGGRVDAAAPLVVTGSLFHSGCEDTGASTCCAGPPTAPSDPEAPLDAVELRLRQGERTWPLGTADASDRGDGYQVVWATTLPAEVAAGPAVLTARGVELPITVVR